MNNDASTIVQESTWPNRIQAVAFITQFVNFSGRKVFQSSKSSGGEVILLCYSSKHSPDKCPFKVRIRRTKVKNSDQQHWYIPKNGLHLHHSDSCEKIEILTKNKKRPTPQHPETLNKSPSPPSELWTFQLDSMLIQLLLACLQGKPDSSDNHGLNEADILRVSRTLCSTFADSKSPTREQVIARFRELGRQYDIYLQVCEKFAWDDSKSKFDASPAAWEEYLEDYPEVRSMQLPLQHSKSITALFTKLQQTVHRKEEKSIAPQICTNAVIPYNFGPMEEKEELPPLVEPELSMGESIVYTSPSPSPHRSKVVPSGGEPIFKSPSSNVTTLPPMNITFRIPDTSLPVSFPNPTEPSAPSESMLYVAKLKREMAIIQDRIRFLEGKVEELQNKNF